MNKKKHRFSREYRELQTKIFIRTALIMMVSVLIIFVLYSYVFFGRFANTVVGFLENYIFGDYYVAMDFYQKTIRNNMSLIFVIAIAVVFLIILRIYLNSFTKYFNEINRGIDALIDENSGDVVLASELSVTEKKINHIKNTLERRKLEARSAEQRKNDLVVYLAHDLKTPLTSIIGYLTLLRDENQISEELREKYLSISLEKAERLEELINEFFDITRFNLSNITLEFSKVNLTRMLEQLVFEFKPMFAPKNLECVLEIAPDIMVRCDVDKMQRVLDNLLRNAVNYSFDNSTINILAVKDEDYINIKFINHGNTIPKEKLKRVFNRFYRLDTARSSNSGGAGLGLAIAKEIVELHHGRIDAKSDNEIIEFEVVIPVGM